MPHNKRKCAFAAALVAIFVSSPARSGTIEAVQARGKLACPVAVGGFYGFSEVGDNGAWKGMDIAICKAIATAILGPGDNVSYIPVSWAQRIPSLQSGVLDLVPSQTQTLTRDTELGIQFSIPYFQAADQLLVKKSLEIRSASDLSGATVCITTGTSTGQLVSNYLRGKHVTYKTLAFENTSQAKEAYLADRCDVFGGYGPVLATMKARDAKDPEANVLLPDLLAGEPTSIALRQGDKPMLNVVNYVVSALLEAEELGISSENVDKVTGEAADNPRVKVLLGITPFLGKKLNLREGWAHDVIKTVGNFGQIYDRSLGGASPYKMERGLNKLWLDGGMLYPIPLL